MDKFKCNITNLSRDFASGKALITLAADASLLPVLEEQLNIDLDCKFTKHSDGKRRSANANAYMWVLLTKMAEKLQEEDSHITKDSIYVQYIRDYGRSVEYEIQNEAVNAMVSTWSNYGLGWFAEIVDEHQGFSLVRFYYGSSCYSRKRMQRLIDAIVMDCKEMNIQTKTPDEIAELLARWGENK